jgi:hypothetical protein
MKLLLAWCVVLLYSMFYNVIHEGDYLDIPIASALYPEKSINKCYSAHTTYSPNTIFTADNANSYDSYKCINLYMSYYIWKPVTRHMKKIHKSKKGCFDFNGEIQFEVGNTIKENINHKQSFTYECKKHNDIQYWGVISNEY